MSVQSGMRRSAWMEDELPPTFNAQCHADVRVVASLAVFLRKRQHLQTNRMSDFIRYVLETFMVNVVPVDERIRSAEEAIQILRDMGFSLGQMKYNNRLVKHMQAQIDTFEDRPYIPSGPGSRKSEAEIAEECRRMAAEMTENLRKQGIGEDLNPRQEAPIAGLPSNVEVV